MVNKSGNAWGAVLLAVAAGLMAGCVTSQQPVAIASGGPAHPDAVATPVTPTPGLLQSYKNFTSAASRGKRSTKPVEDMKNMGSDSMPDMNHSAMKNMHGEMEGMQEEPPKQPLPAEESHEH